MKTIHAVYENAVFRPLDSVDLPEHAVVKVESECKPTTKALFKAFAGGIGVAGVGFSTFCFVASMMMFHGDNTIPLLCALYAGILAAGVAGCAVRIVFKQRIL